MDLHLTRRRRIWFCVIVAFILWIPLMGYTWFWNRFEVQAVGLAAFVTGGWGGFFRWFDYYGSDEFQKSVEPIGLALNIGITLGSIVSLIALISFFIRRFRLRGRCDECGYNLHGLDGNSCPECGALSGLTGRRAS